MTLVEREPEPEQGNNMEFFLQPKEVEVLAAFLDEHRICWLDVDDDHRHIKLEFTQTGIGVATVVRCRACDLEENITDVSTWLAEQSQS